MYSLHDPLELGDVVANFPTIAATSPHHSRSPTYYRPVSTLTVLEAMAREGFNVHGVQAARVRDASKRGFQKHLIRLRHSDTANSFRGSGTIGGKGYGIGDEAPEVLIINSHDGSTSWEMYAGIIRFACANGLIVGTQWEGIRVRHAGNASAIAASVIGGAYRMRETFASIADCIGRFKAIDMPRHAALAFAGDAFALRYPTTEEANRAPMAPRALIDSIHRPEDDRGDLWTVFNRTQENLLRGDFRGRRIGGNGRPRNFSQRPIGGIDQTVSLNRRLFDLARRYADNLEVAA